MVELGYHRRYTRKLADHRMPAPECKSSNQQLKLYYRLSTYWDQLVKYLQ
jgi:hypothetical protein